MTLFMPAERTTHSIPEASAGLLSSGRLRFSQEQSLIAGLLFIVAWLNYIDRQILSVLVPVMKPDTGGSRMAKARRTA